MRLVPWPHLPARLDAWRSPLGPVIHSSNKVSLTPQSSPVHSLFSLSPPPHSLFAKSGPSRPSPLAFGLLALSRLLSVDHLPLSSVLASRRTPACTAPLD